MFTVKFIRDNPPQPETESDLGSETIVSVSCPHYEVLDRRNGYYTVTTFKDHFDTSGVERHVRLDHFHSCYVENEAGKTIYRCSYEPQAETNQYCA